MVVNGTFSNQDERMVKKEILHLETQIKGKDLKKTLFDLVSIPHKVILGIPWLEKTNPSIDWHMQRITFRRKSLKKPTHKMVRRMKICEVSQK